MAVEADEDKDDDEDEDDDRAVVMVGAGSIIGDEGDSGESADGEGQEQEDVGMRMAKGEDKGEGGVLPPRTQVAGGGQLRTCVEGMDAAVVIAVAVAVVNVQHPNPAERKLQLQILEHPRMCVDAGYAGEGECEDYMDPRKTGVGNVDVVGIGNDDNYDVVGIERDVVGV
ncbi:hypothetical protein BGZ73_008671 [Actinomortierella ambigua]|nr:hypothetical protein BGZ73_008671 [Actinomortierella ambigua]